MNWTMFDVLEVMLSMCCYVVIVIRIELDCVLRRGGGLIEAWYEEREIHVDTFESWLERTL